MDPSVPDAPAVPRPAPASPHDDGPDPLPGHRHPHPPGDPSGLPRIAVVGAGRVGLALAIAIDRAGWPVTAVATRDPGRAAELRARVPSAAERHLAALPDAADLILVTVPDDAIAEVASRVRLYAGQGIAHTSGALPAEVLAPARGAGAALASFHPLVPFAETDRAVASLRGATVALEGDPPLVALLADVATALGAQPVRLPPGGKAAYHAAAVLAAGGFIALLDAIAEVARGAGLDEPGALAIYAPLIRAGLANAEAGGIAGALTGPFVRGDAGTVRDHLAALDRLAPGARDLYRAAARREIALARARGDLSAERAAALAALLVQHGAA
ncbi:MAG: Rossmann-like and DUF2520 domain-containing protein [Chloroflexota bacterium]